MKNTIILAVLLLLSASLYSQQNGDSLRTGRACKIVLYNGFQTEGNIIFRGADTVILQTDITKLYIPVKDIKFVLNPDVELSDIEPEPTGSFDEDTAVTIKTGFTDDCDIYLDDKSSLIKVKLSADTDSTLKVLKDGRYKVISIASIRKIEFKPETPFGKGYFIGSLVGAGVGLITALAFTGGYGVVDIPGLIAFCGITSIPGGIIGGVIGLLTAENDVFLFDKGNSVVKSKRIRYLIEKHLDK